jgi:ribosomal protein S18 acetylase RimI-like enzyme
MKNNIVIRLTTEADMSAIHALVHELAVYERAPEAHTATIEDYLRDFKAGIFESHVAVNMDESLGKQGEIVGMIFYYMAYSTWKGRMLYLEDFVVTESYRQYGVGQMLFETFLEIAREKECRLVKWQVLDWNEPAIKFYRKNEAIIENDWYNGKIFLN